MGLKVFSVFTGAGGFEQGMPDGWECIGFSEIDKYCNMVLKYHWPNIKNYGDINGIDWTQIPDFDVLWGGSPCQDLSLAGKRKGLSGERSGLFFAFTKALRDKLPDYFIWENVKGALSSNQGWDFAEVLNQFSALGYNLWWQVLNAKDFGVPQNRERIFIVGSRRGSPPEIFYKFKNSRKVNELYGLALTAKYFGGQANGNYIVESGGKALQEITRDKAKGERIYSTEGLATALTGNGGGLGAKSGLYAIRDLNIGGTFGTLRSGGSGGVPSQRVVIPVLTPDRLKKRQNGRRFKKDGDSSFTLTGQDIHGVQIGTPTIDEETGEEVPFIRRLTPLECERLMGWKDDWTKYGIDEKGNKVEISDTQRYKMCGNGVVSNVIKEITGKIL